jgi:hypothetical protein
MKRIYQHKCSACGEYSFAFHEGSNTETTYQWVCDNCGIQMNLRFFDGGQQVEQTPTGKRCERTLALLRMRDNPGFMFILKGCAWDGDLSGNKYYYEDHTCPSNSMRACEEVIAGGDADPHGIFEIVEEHLVTGANARPREEVLEKLTASALEKRVSLTPQAEAPATCDYE